MKRYCLREDVRGKLYVVDSRRLSDFEGWLKWINSVDPTSEEFTDFFPIGNRLSAEPPDYAKVVLSLHEWSFSDLRVFVCCGKKLECGSTCIDELGHDGDCLCAGDEDGESGTCLA
jgi:hypothetical protein